MLVCFLSSSKVFAAASDSGLWLGPQVSYQFSDKWSFAGSSELRYFRDFKQLNQVLFHLEASYKISPKVSASFGLSYMGTDRLTMQDEYRPWQGLLVTLPIGNHEIALREKIEERYYPGFNNKFALRFRTMLGYSKNLDHNKNLYFVASDEVFMSSRDTDWGTQSPWEQNRFKVGFKITKYAPVVFQISYQNQHIFRENARDSNIHLLVFEPSLKLKRTH